ncbi:MAG: sulfurtransferase TusA family protein [Pseudomonadota bacterium]
MRKDAKNDGAAAGEATSGEPMPGEPTSDPIPGAAAPEDGPLIDARGLLCPLPVLRLRKALAALAPGQTVRILADDPMAQIDIPHFCTETGHVLIEASPRADGICFKLRRQ